MPGAPPIPPVCHAHTRYTTTHCHPPPYLVLIRDSETGQCGTESPLILMAGPRIAHAGGAGRGGAVGRGPAVWAYVCPVSRGPGARARVVALGTMAGKVAPGSSTGGRAHSPCASPQLQGAERRTIVALMRVAARPGAGWTSARVCGHRRAGKSRHGATKGSSYLVLRVSSTTGWRQTHAQRGLTNSADILGS